MKINWKLEKKMFAAFFAETAHLGVIFSKLVGRFQTLIQAPEHWGCRARWVSSCGKVFVAV